MYAPTKSLAAIVAKRRGFRAFETRRVKLDPDAWLCEERPYGDGVKYAELYAESVDFVHHVEITELLKPILVVTCRRDELPKDVPALFDIVPVTPSLFDVQRDPKPKPLKTGPAARTRNEPAMLHKNVDPAELARALLILGSMETPAPPPVVTPSVSGGLSLAELAAKIIL